MPRDNDQCHYCWSLSHGWYRRVGRDIDNARRQCPGQSRGAITVTVSGMLLLVQLTRLFGLTLVWCRCVSQIEMVNTRSRLPGTSNGHLETESTAEQPGLGGAFRRPPPNEPLGRGPELSLVETLWWAMLFWKRQPWRPGYGIV
ncbi:hypothetical protein L6452_09172 [Arctium lappa]|uniref:Uncharacterized protein n=1 Tax=Arctium lappa TaxID=4217 RepID=A0ACB9DK43_ARCLA|nr:hypothetical protein L6452_09172 [Arctium lappa]